MCRDWPEVPCSIIPQYGIPLSKISHSYRENPSPKSTPAKLHTSFKGSAQALPAFKLYQPRRISLHLSTTILDILALLTRNDLVFLYAFISFRQEWCFGVLRFQQRITVTLPSTFLYGHYLINLEVKLSPNYKLSCLRCSTGLKYKEDMIEVHLPIIFSLWSFHRKQAGTRKVVGTGGVEQGGRESQKRC